MIFVKYLGIKDSIGDDYGQWLQVCNTNSGGSTGGNTSGGSSGNGGSTGGNSTDNVFDLTIDTNGNIASSLGVRKDEVIFKLIIGSFIKNISFFFSKKPTFRNTAVIFYTHFKNTSFFLNKQLKG